jgi:hypothetical protein
MHALVIQITPGDAAITVATLAAALGATAYEAHSRMQVPGGGPSVVATFPSAREAQPLFARLQAAGVPTWLCDASIAGEVAAREVRSFSITAHGLHGTTHGGEAFELPWTAIEIAIRGLASSTEIKHERIEKRELSLGRALLSGGLVVSKTTKVVRDTSTTTAQGVLVLYGYNASTLCFRESSLLYQGLGAEMQPSRAANFNALAHAIRQRAASATYDDRLLRRAIQQQILGPTLNADTSFDFAVALIALTRARALA